jgi:outer membrane lipoprotein-sorting protein
MNKFLAAIILATCIAASSPALAAVNLAKYGKDVARIEAYLKVIESIKADFSQVAPSGDVSEGVFYMKRPGKMRWEYKPPTPILLVADGKTITYYDAELEQVSYIDIEDTIAGFLSKGNWALNTGTTELVGFEKTPSALRASVAQRGKPENGTLTLEFSDNPLKLKQFVVTDQAGGETRVALQNARFGDKLPDRLFRFQDPRKLKSRR